MYMYNINIYYELYMKHNQHLLNSSRFMLSTCEKKTRGTESLHEAEQTPWCF